MSFWFQACVLLEISAILEVTSAASLVGNFSEGSPVYGLGTMYDNIYVIHEGNISDIPHDIIVYGKPSDGYPLKELINVKGMKGPYDMIVIPNIMLNIASIVDWFDTNSIVNVALHYPHTPLKWNFKPSKKTSVGLSEFAEDDGFGIEHFLLVTETVTNELKEFSIYPGEPKKSIVLRNITNPRQAIKLSVAKYAVCFGYAATEKHQVCLVDSNGYTVPGQCFGGSPGSSLTQLNVPARLYQRRDGSILVADLKNQKILKLNNSSISDPAQVVVSKVDGLSGPYRMFVDEDRSLLYVADNTLDPQTGYAMSGRVLVYKI